MRRARARCSGGQASDQNGDEDDVVHAEDDLERGQRSGVRSRLRATSSQVHSWLLHGLPSVRARLRFRRHLTLLYHHAEPRTMRLSLREQHICNSRARDRRTPRAFRRARSPASRCSIMLRQREQRQHLLHVAPEVRIELLPLREHPGVLDMPEADVERRQREPGAIRLLDARRAASP